MKNYQEMGAKHFWIPGLLSSILVLYFSENSNRALQTSVKADKEIAQAPTNIKTVTRMIQVLFQQQISFLTLSQT